METDYFAFFPAPTGTAASQFSGATAAFLKKSLTLEKKSLTLETRTHRGGFFQAPKPSPINFPL
jgi:hypothetical protein